MKKSQRAKRKSKKGLIIGLTIAAGAVAAGIGIFVYFRYFQEGKERLSADDYYLLEQKIPEGEAMVVLNGEVLEEKGLLKNNSVYLNINFVRNNLNDRFYFDAETDGLLYTDGQGTMVINSGSNEYTDTDGSSRSAERAPVLKVNGEYYMDVAFLEKYTTIDYSYCTEPSRLGITLFEDETQCASANKDLVVRYYAGVKSQIVDDLEVGEKVSVLGTEGDWTKVSTTDGFVGYVKSSGLTYISYEKSIPGEDTFTHISMNKPISLAWMIVANSDANANATGLMQEVQSLDIISPTWYQLGDSEGTINDYSSASVVNEMHNNGYKVWPVITDISETGSVDLDALLSSKTLRTRIINRLISDAKDLKYDGINVDLEKVTIDSADDYLQFIRELSVECRKNKIILSVDNYPPKLYNVFLDYEEQNQYVDYLIMMNYDEYSGNSETAGPTSSIGYVSENIDAALEYIDADRLVNGISLYVKAWKIDTATGEVVGFENILMADIANIISDKNAKTEWDEESGQDVVTYTVDDYTYKIWIEDERSIKTKLNLVKEKGLAGVAFWALGYEDDSVWNLVTDYKNK